MSNVKLKNSLYRLLIERIADGTFPQGVEIEARLQERRIWVDITNAPFYLYKTDKITITPDSYMVNLSIGSVLGEDPNYTDEANDLIKRMTEMAREHLASQCRVIVTGDTRWIRKQVNAWRAPAAPAARSEEVSIPV